MISVVLRVDLQKSIQLRADASDTEIVVKWIRLLVQDFELLIAWAVMWLVLHIGLILVGGTLLGPGRGAPAPVVIAVEGFPGFLVFLFIIRLGIAGPRLVRLIDVVGGARGRFETPPAWSQRAGILLWLVRPSDFDFVIALVVVFMLELLLR